MPQPGLTNTQQAALSAIQIDDTDKLAVSLYADGGAPGDTALEYGTYGLKVALVDAGVPLADGSSNTIRALQGYAGDKQPYKGAMKFSYNGATWDRDRNNVEAVLLASAARTVETNSADQINYNGTGLIIVVSVTDDPATADITPELQIKDSISGSYFTIWTAAAAISAVGVYAYLFVPGGAAGSYTEAVNLRIARTWRLQMNVADADSMTYSVSAVVLV